MCEKCVERKQAYIQDGLDEIRELVEQGNDHPNLSDFKGDEENKTCARLAMIAARCATVVATIKDTPVFVQMGEWAHICMEGETKAGAVLIASLLGGIPSDEIPVDEDAPLH